MYGYVTDASTNDGLYFNVYDTPIEERQIYWNVPGRIPYEPCFFDHSAKSYFCCKREIETLWVEVRVSLNDMAFQGESIVTLAIAPVEGTFEDHVRMPLSLDLGAPMLHFSLPTEFQDERPLVGLFTVVGFYDGKLIPAANGIPIPAFATRAGNTDSWPNKARLTNAIRAMCASPAFNFFNFPTDAIGLSVQRGDNVQNNYPVQIKREATSDSSERPSQIRPQMATGVLWVSFDKTGEEYRVSAMSLKK
jgi:hypothetical protein